MRTTKYLGFLTVGMGILIVACAAVMPVATGPAVRAPLNFSADGGVCGPAAYAVLDPVHDQCTRAARQRLAWASVAGLLLAVVGLTMMAGPDDRPQSRVDLGPRREGWRSRWRRRHGAEGPAETA